MAIVVRLKVMITRSCVHYSQFFVRRQFYEHISVRCSAGGAYNAPPDPLAGLRGPLLRGGEKEER